MILRPASLEELPAVVTLAQHFLAATAYGPLLRAKPEIIHQTATLLVSGHGVILVAEAEVSHIHHSFLEGECPYTSKQLVAFLAVYAGPHPFSGELVGDELGWWIEPGARGGRLAHKMLGWIERWGRQNGLSVLKLVAPAGSNLGKHYEQRGYTFVESAYQITFL